MSKRVGIRPWFVLRVYLYGVVMIADPRLRKEFHSRLAMLARESTGSSNRVARLMIMAEPPSMDVGECTDKGSINQRNVLRQRAAMVDELYAATPSPRTITLKTSF